MPFARVKISEKIPVGVNKVWCAITTEDGLNSWLCNSSQPSLEPGSIWNLLGIHFWGGEWSLMFAIENQKIVFRWYLEGSAHTVCFDLEESNVGERLVSTVQCQIEYQKDANFGFGNSVDPSLGLEILTRYWLTLLNTTLTGQKKLQRVDILKNPLPAETYKITCPDQTSNKLEKIHSHLAGLPYVMACFPNENQKQPFYVLKENSTDIETSSNEMMSFSWEGESAPPQLTTTVLHQKDSHVGYQLLVELVALEASYKVLLPTSIK